MQFLGEASEGIAVFAWTHVMHSSEPCARKGVCGFFRTEKGQKTTLAGGFLSDRCSVLHLGEFAFAVHHCGFKFWLGR